MGIYTLLIWSVISMMQPQPAADLLALTVLNGTGSGLYKCGSTVTIKAPRTVPTYGTGDDRVVRRVKEDLVFAEWFSDWTGDVSIDKVHKNKARLKMPACPGRAVSVEPRYMAQPPRK